MVLKFQSRKMELNLNLNMFIICVHSFFLGVRNAPIDIYIFFGHVHHRGRSAVFRAASFGSIGPRKTQLLSFRRGLLVSAQGKLESVRETVLDISETYRFGRNRTVLRVSIQSHRACVSDKNWIHCTLDSSAVGRGVRSYL